MAKNKLKTSFDPQDLPQKDVFIQKEVYQYKQPADTGKPIEDQGNNKAVNQQGNDINKTSKEEGLNEEKSNGTAGAFEGFENRRKVD